VNFQSRLDDAGLALRVCSAQQPKIIRNRVLSSLWKIVLSEKTTNNQQMRERERERKKRRTITMKKSAELKHPDPLVHLIDLTPPTTDNLLFL
jgi:DNA-binding transcriptional regulator PaaX